MSQEAIPLLDKSNEKLSEKGGDAISEKKKQKYGQAIEFDPNFKGPINNRSCTDIICLILFFVFTLASVIVALYAYSRSNPLLLIYPSDSQGNLCGHGKMESKPYLHFFDLLQCAKSLPKLPFTGCPTPQVCVEQCPNTTWSWQTLDATEKSRGIDASARRSQLVCSDQVDFTTPNVTATSSNSTTTASTINDANKWLKMPLSELVQKGYCAPYLVAELPVMKRCVPELIINVANTVVGQAMPGNATLYDAEGGLVTVDRLVSSKRAIEVLVSFKSWVQASLADLAASWRQIVIFISITLGVSFIYIFIMRFFVGVLIWISIILFVILWFSATTFAFWRYSQLSGRVKTPENLKALASLFSNEATDKILGNKLIFPNETSDLWLGIAIASLVILVVTLLVLCFLGSRIRLAINLFEETSVAIGHMPSVLIWPIFPFALQMAVLALAIGTAICLATLSKPQFANSAKPGLINLPDSLTNCDLPEGINVSNTSNHHNLALSRMCHFVTHDASKLTIWFQIFNVFSFFWAFNFVSGFGMVVLAGSFASYYWAFKKPEDLPWVPLLGAMWRTVRYHIGSIAFGSLLIAILQIIHILLDYVMYKLKEQKNNVAVYLMKCFMCCFSCLEHLVKFVTRKAYIGIAIHGSHFLSSAAQGWQLVMRNAARTTVLSGVSRLIIIISKLIVTGGIVTLGYFYFHGELVSAWPALAESWPKLNYFYVPLIVVGIAAYAVASLCFHVYEVGVETMFLCFLEDCERNDGSEGRPYFMSKRLAAILK